jgi:hypothetical protein
MKPVRNAVGLLGVLGALGLGLLLGPGCGDDCSTAQDCVTGEVCYLGACVQSQQDFVTCFSTAECNNGAADGPFVCSSSRCQLKNSVTDAGTN